MYWMYYIICCNEMEVCKFKLFYTPTNKVLMVLLRSDHTVGWLVGWMISVEQPSSAVFDGLQWNMVPVIYVKCSYSQHFFFRLVEMLSLIGWLAGVLLVIFSDNYCIPLCLSCQLSVICINVLHCNMHFFMKIKTVNAFYVFL